MKIPALIGMFVAAGLVSACGSGSAFDDPDNVNHGCTLLRTEGRWDQQLTLYHTDPRSCPAGGAPGDFRLAGGTVKENLAFSPSSAQLLSLDLKIYSTADNMCSALGSLMGNQQQNFGYFDFNNTGPSWNAPVFAGYVQGTFNPNYDCPLFYVNYVNGEQGVAWTRIKYYDSDY